MDTHSLFVVGALCEHTSLWLVVVEVCKYFILINSNLVGSDEVLLHEKCLVIIYTKNIIIVCGI